VLLTAPLDGVVATSSRLHVGLSVARGAPVVELRPRATSGRSFAGIESESKLADERLVRLEELFAVEAVSRAELDRARAHAATLRAELDAVRGTGRTVPVAAPFSGSIAEIMVTPGEAVAAGASLARLVQTDPLWVEVGLRPEVAGTLGSSPAGLVIQGGPGQAPISFGARSVRLVSRAPEVDRTTGLVQTVIEVRGAEGLRVGTAVQAEVLLPGQRTGIVVPAEAIVDDAGVPVVYLQPEGESFVRREIRIIGRQGDRVLVEGLGRADRFVTRGAAAIRRSAQMSSGAVEGHVH
jgi:membrane fusion protein (multidrug efflux system)